MAEIPLFWRAYAELQSNLNNRTCVDPISWGMEAGLNYLLEAENLDIDQAQVGRAVTSAARRSRYARSLLAKHIITENEVCNEAGLVEAKWSLAALKCRMPASKLELLIDVAIGLESKQLSKKHGIAIGALRTRVARARQTARSIAA